MAGVNRVIMNPYQVSQNILAYQSATFWQLRVNNSQIYYIISGLSLSIKFYTVLCELNDKLHICINATCRLVVPWTDQHLRMHTTINSLKWKNRWMWPTWCYMYQCKYMYAYLRDRHESTSWRHSFCKMGPVPDPNNCEQAQVHQGWGCQSSYHNKSHSV